MSQIDQNDKRTLRCRMLGHEVSFEYCRCGTGPLPCRKIFDCWFESFPVESFLREHYNPSQIRQILTPPRDKLTTLVDLIHQAQKNNPPK